VVERLTILKVEQDEEISLQTNQQDVWTTAIKVISSCIPFGSPIGELISSFIPNQKIERVIKVTEKFNEKLIDHNSKLNDHEKRITILELKNVEFADLYEEGANQASRALTDERLEYIASLLKNSLTDEELKHIEKKKLLSLLGELNDAEIIWLKSYSLNSANGLPEYEDFHKTHEDTLKPVNITFGIPDSIAQGLYNKEAIQKSYQNNLLNLRLISESFKSIKKDEMPEFDNRTGKIKVSH
jgi:hypothetical protein